MDFEIIDGSEVVAVKRGRKSTVPPALVEAMKSLPTGKALRVPTLKCDPKADNFKSAKSTVSASLRKAGELAGLRIGIAWSPDGVPQVQVKGKVKN
jgi:hypothetical protein